MSVRKRSWTTSKGEEKTAWVVDYIDQHGTRRLKTFEKKKEADSYRATATVEVQQGIHVEAAASTTVVKAGELWIKTAENSGLERSTINQYKQHLANHINKFIGNAKLSDLSIPGLRAFEDKLRDEGRSPAMVKKVMTSLGSLLGDAQERGLVARNMAREIRGKRHKGRERQAERRQKGRIKVGVDLPCQGRDQSDCGSSGGALEAIAADGDLQRHALKRIARVALAGRGLR